MKKVVAILFITLDGVIQAPGGPEEDTTEGFKYGGWVGPYTDDFSGEVMSRQMSLEGSELLLGRKTFEIFAADWPHHAADWPGINEVKKVCCVSQFIAQDELEEFRASFRQCCRKGEET